MTKINLAKALKVKNSIAGEINRLRNILSRENSRQDTSTSTVSREEVWNNLKNKINDLVILKSKIAVANVGIYPVLAKMEEAKSLITFLQTLNTTDGIVKTPLYVRAESRFLDVKHTAFLKREDIDKHVEDLQKEIEMYQDQVDTYNATTTIEV